MYSYNDFYNDISNIGLSGEETIMIHSSFSSIKNIEGGANSVLKALKSFFKNGLLLFPTHTWGSIRNDNDIMDKNSLNSNVGYLTNMAIKDSDFLRSNHPTHSVCAYGRDAKNYIIDDNYAKTPASPNGSFGKLKNNGYILFIGCSLSRNTFVHSIEEEMGVSDRFTNHIYTFFTKNNDEIMEFHMPRHYNEKCPHISDNYEKLLPVMLNLGIAKKVKILDSTSYLVDAHKCRNLVISILKKDIHAFDDQRDIEGLV